MLVVVSRPFADHRFRVFFGARRALQLADPIENDEWILALGALVLFIARNAVVRLASLFEALLHPCEQPAELTKHASAGVVYFAFLAEHGALGSLGGGWDFGGLFVGKVPLESCFWPLSA